MIIDLSTDTGRAIVAGDTAFLLKRYTLPELLDLLGNVFTYWDKLTDPMTILALRLAVGVPDSAMLYYAAGGGILGGGFYAVLAVFPDKVINETFMGTTVREIMLQNLTPFQVDAYMAMERACGTSMLLAIQRVVTKLKCNWVTTFDLPVRDGYVAGKLTLGLPRPPGITGMPGCWVFDGERRSDHMRFLARGAILPEECVADIARVVHLAGACDTPEDFPEIRAALSPDIRNDCDLVVETPILDYMVVEIRLLGHCFGYRVFLHHKRRFFGGTYASRDEALALMKP